MECPQCGFLIDAFAKECPRCKRHEGLGQAPTPNAKSGKAPGAPRPATAMTRLAPPRAGAPAATASFPAHLAQLIGVFGALLVLLGTFLPYRYLPKFSNTISIFQIGSSLSAGMDKLHGYFLGASMAVAGVQLFAYIGMVAWILALLAAVGGLVAALLKRAVGLWVAGGMSALIALCFIWGYFFTMTTRFANDKSMFAAVQLGIGPILLLIGAIVMLTAAALPHPHPDE
jgi:hypothetical protein